MKIRRVVTGHRADGSATVTSDSDVEAVTIAMAPGWEFLTLWGSDTAPTFPDAGSPQPFPTYFPPVGGYRFGLFTVPPESAAQPVPADPEAALQEAEQTLPGLLARMEPDHPGMHTSDTIDFETILSGEIWLELDNGETVHLRAGDTVIQNGTRHAWRNRGSEPCRILVCLIGAHRH